MARHKHKRTDKTLNSVPTSRKGTINRKIIAAGQDDKREYTLHATKGYRSHKL